VRRGTSARIQFDPGGIHTAAIHPSFACRRFVLPEVGSNPQNLVNVCHGKIAIGDYFHFLHIWLRQVARSHPGQSENTSINTNHKSAHFKETKMAAIHQLNGDTRRFMSMGSLSQEKFLDPPEPNSGQVLIRPSFPTGCQIRQLDRLWLSNVPALIDLLQVITGFFLMQINR
jgi:hypothetical protein